MESIFQYLDYRRFLKDFYASKKAQDKSYSYRVFLNRAGISSPSFLKQVIDGKRNLTPDTVEKFLLPLKLGKTEADFFRTLVLFNQAKSNEQKNVHYQTLRQFARKKNIPLVNEDKYAYYDHWYISAIRELVTQVTLPLDEKSLAQTLYPPISPKKFQQAVELLVKLDLIKEYEGRYHQTETLITTGPEVHSLIVREFNKQMIERALDSIDHHSVDVRNMRGVTMGISADSYALLVQEIERFQNRVMDIVHLDSNPDSVYQMNIQLFPLLKQAENKEETP